MSDTGGDPDRLTEADGRRSLREHAIERALLARTRHGPTIDASALARLLDDRAVVRYPVALRFDGALLHPGEFAWARQRGSHPSEGFDLVIHASFRDRPELWPLLAAYHLPAINYGEIAEPADCEAFGAALLGLGVEEYYATLCSLVDSL